MVELTYLKNHKSPDNFSYLILTAIVTFLLQISKSNLLHVLKTVNFLLKVEKSPLNLNNENREIQFMLKIFYVNCGL